MESLQLFKRGLVDKPAYWCYSVCVSFWWQERHLTRTAGIRLLTSVSGPLSAPGQENVTNSWHLLWTTKQQTAEEESKRRDREIRKEIQSPERNDIYTGRWKRQNRKKRKQDLVKIQCFIMDCSKSGYRSDNIMNDCKNQSSFLCHVRLAALIVQNGATSSLTQEE